MRRAVYLIVQEGGTTGELYVHTHNNRRSAEKDRVSCAGAGYRTTPVIRVPRALADTPRFYEILEAVARSVVTDLDYAEE